MGAQWVTYDSLRPTLDHLCGPSPQGLITFYLPAARNTTQYVIFQTTPLSGNREETMDRLTHMGGFSVFESTCEKANFDYTCNFLSLDLQNSPLSNGHFMRGNFRKILRMLKKGPVCTYGIYKHMEAQQCPKHIGSKDISPSSSDFPIYRPVLICSLFPEDGVVWKIPFS